MTSISSSTFNVSSYSPTQGISGAHGPGRHKPDFSKLDTDGSGGLSKSEFQTMIDNGPGRRGGVSGTSDTSSTDELFSKLDSDGDGSVSQTELEAGKPLGESSNNGMSQMGLSTSDFAQMMGLQGGMPMQGPPPGPPPDGGDGDGDGDTSGTTSTSSTSGSSSSDQLSKLFDAIDSDGSGSLSSSEVSDFRKKMQDIFGSLGQQMQNDGNQQYQWFSQDGGAGTTAGNTISYNA